MCPLVSNQHAHLLGRAHLATDLTRRAPARYTHPRPRPGRSLGGPTAGRLPTRPGPPPRIILATTVFLVASLLVVEGGGTDHEIGTVHGGSGVAGDCAGSCCCWPLISLLVAAQLTTNSSLPGSKSGGGEARYHGNLGVKHLLGEVPLLDSKSGGGGARYRGNLGVELLRVVLLLDSKRHLLMNNTIVVILFVFYEQA